MEKKVIYFCQISNKFQGQISKICFFCWKKIEKRLYPPVVSSKKWPEKVILKDDFKVHLRGEGGFCPRRNWTEVVTDQISLFLNTFKRGSFMYFNHFFSKKIFFTILAQIFLVGVPRLRGHWPSDRESPIFIQNHAKKTQIL